MSGLRRLPGGSSRQVWSVDAEIDGTAYPLVIRYDPTYGTDRTSLQSPGGFLGEFQILKAMHGHGVRVPEVFWGSQEPELLGGPFYLMRRIEGETIPRRILRSDELAEARQALPALLGRELARIHSLDVEREGLDFLPAPAAGASSPETQLLQIRAGFDQAPNPNPTLELVYRWLAENAPPERGRTIVHGDFRIGNFIVGPEGLRAVLDWELCHVGDPHEDLAWMCTKTWRFGNLDLPVGGMGEREPFYVAYEEESGRTLDRAALRYWEMLCSAKVAVVWILQVAAYMSGAIPTVEHAAIGRRLPETELDLLQLLEEA